MGFLTNHVCPIEGLDPVAAAWQKVLSAGTLID